MASLRDRPAGQCVMEQLLALQAAAPARTRFDAAVGRSPLLEESRSWFLGALGEVAVGRQLAGLPDGWHVLHALPVGKDGSDIDHVVIGPGGVFTVNTKHHSGQKVWVAGRTVMVAGTKHPYVRNAEHEAGRAAKLLTAACGEPVRVTPLVVLVDPGQLTVRERPAEVVVMSATRLVRWLRKRPAVLTPEQVGALLAAAERPDTWQAVTGPPVVGVEGRFAALRAEVRAAQRVRRAWAAGLAALGCVTVVTAGPALLGQLAP